MFTLIKYLPVNCILRTIDNTVKSKLCVAKPRPTIGGLQSCTTQRRDHLIISKRSVNSCKFIKSDQEPSASSSFASNIICTNYRIMPTRAAWTFCCSHRPGSSATSTALRRRRRRRVTYESIKNIKWRAGVSFISCATTSPGLSRLTGHRERYIAKPRMPAFNILVNTLSNANDLLCYYSSRSSLRPRKTKCQSRALSLSYRFA